MCVFRPQAPDEPPARTSSFWTANHTRGRGTRSTSSAAPDLRLCALALTVLGCLAACQGEIAEPENQGNGPQPGLQPTAPVAGSSAAAGAGAAQPSASASPTAPGASTCQAQPGPAPLRRLTRFEYNNSVRDLLGDTTQPARAFPSDEIGNGFGNDADAQSVSSLLVEQYGTVAESVAARATETPAALAKLDGCAMTLTAASEAACARTILNKLGTRAYRRALAADESEALAALYTAARPDGSFAVALATGIEAILQAPDFLYRVELGAADGGAAPRRKPTGHEMATRLSYLFWGTLPDEKLRTAAEAGELSSASGVSTHAKRMLDDPRARVIVRFFFDNLLPIASLAQLERDPKLYPSYTSAIGALMREETHTFLEYEIWEGSGTWPGALTAPYTFVNDALAKYYGMPSVNAATFQKVALDPTQRLGLLTQGGMQAGTTHSNNTNPVVRGSFVAQKLMCRPLALPTDPAILAQVKPPDPYSGKTARDRYGAHSKNPVCAACHQFMDPIGLTFENFDAVGLYRTTENGETIDATGALPGTPGMVKNAVELARALAASDETSA